MPPQVDPATRVPDYDLLRLIGRGSYGDVWLARGVTGVFRAVKIVWRDRFTDIRPYEREFEGITRFTAISLREPSQLALLHVGRDDTASYFYYVMELADDATRGREIIADEYVPLTLREVRERRGRLPAGEIVALGVSLARALASLHATGLVHRDIKPSNIVFVGGVPKLADVGLVAEASAGLTFVGTEGFVPPEGPGAPSADVFSLGKVLYELATGLDRSNFPRLPADLNEWPDRKEFLELNEVLIRACEPDARNRFPDAAALLEELLLLQAGKSVRRLRNADRIAGRAKRVAFALAVVALFAGAGAWIENRRAATAEAERDASARREVYSATLTQAQRALEQDEYGRARKFLQSVMPKPSEPDIRGFEWHALWSDAQGDSAIILRASGSSGARVRYSSVGRQIATHTIDGEVILWDAEKKNAMLSIENVRQFGGFSEDGRWIIGTTLESGKARLHRWSTLDGSLDNDISFGASRPLGAIGKNQWLVEVQSATDAAVYLRCCDFSTGKDAWKYEVPFTGEKGGGYFYSSAVATDGNTCALVLGHRDNATVLWRLIVLSLPDMKIKWNEITNHRISAIAFGSHGDTLVSIWDDSGEAHCLDLRLAQWRWHVQMPANRITTLTYDGDHLFAVGGRSGSIALLDSETGRIVGSRRGYEADIQDAVFLNDRLQLLTTGSDGDVRLWPLGKGSAQREISGFWAPSAGGREVRVSDDGLWLAATMPGPTDENGNVRGAHTRLIQFGNSGTSFEITSATAPVTFSKDSELLWTLGTDDKLNAHSLKAPFPVVSTIKLPFKTFIASSSADSRWIGCLDLKGALSFVNIDQKTSSLAIDSGHGYPYWITLSTDGKLAATSGRDLSVRLWDITDRRQIAAWKMPDSIVNGAFSPDDRNLALIHSNGLLEVHTVIGDSSPIKVPTSTGFLQAIAFDRAEPRLFLGGRDGTVLVIDTTRWREITQLRSTSFGQKPGAMARATMAKNGSLLAGYTESGMIRLWRIIPEY